MNRVFADTSLFVAFISERDDLHSLATKFFDEGNDLVVTTDWVLMELGNYLSKTSYRSEFLPFVLQSITILNRPGSWR